MTLTERIEANKETIASHIERMNLLWGERKLLIIEAYEAGYSIEQLVEEFVSKETTVRKYLTEAGLLSADSPAPVFGI